MKKIAIIGANGYIGRNLVHILKRDYSNYEVMLYGRQRRNIDGYSNYLSVDMSLKDEVGNIDLNCDIVFMLAGRTGTSIAFDEYTDFINSNECAVLNLLSEYHRQKSKARIIYPSTRLVYKGSDEPLTESSPKEFNTIYAINKYSCEKYFKQYHNLFNVQYTIFRISLPYGSLISGASSYGTADFMINSAKNNKCITLYGKGNLKRTLTYIEDICNIMITGSMEEKCANNVFNIGGEAYRLEDMARLIAKKYTADINYIPWPEMAYKIESGDTVFNSSKLDNIIGHLYRTKFIDWINAN